MYPIMKLVASLFSCAHCSHPVSGSFLPLCQWCRHALELAGSHGTPPVSVVLDELGSQEKIEIHPLFRGGGLDYPILRTWKKRGGALLSRRIFELMSQVTLNWLRELSQTNDRIFLVPMPTTPLRSQALGGHRSWEIATQLKKRIAIAEVLPALTRPNTAAPRQASLGLFDRTHQSIQFHSAPGGLKIRARPGAPVVLIDDFLTTGNTFRSAALQLRLSRLQNSIHGVVLAARLPSPTIVEERAATLNISESSSPGRKPARVMPLVHNPRSSS